MTPPADTIVIVSTPTCQRCKIAAKHLDAAGVQYQYIDATQDEKWAAWMAEQGLRNVPQIVKGDQRVEGLDFDAINRLF
jgi:glutaredoxin